MRILIIIAGTNVPSNSETLAHAFIEGLRQIPECHTDTLTLRTLDLRPFSLACYEPGFQPEEDFVRLQAALESADGFVIASPIWNFGVPGHLKNAIDRCGSFGVDAETRTTGQWNGKPFYLIFTGGAPHAVWSALIRRTLSGIPTALRYFDAVHIGTHYEGRCTTGKGRFGLVVDQRPKSLETMRTLGTAFGHIVQTHAQTGKLPLKQRIVHRIDILSQRLRRIVS